MQSLFDDVRYAARALRSSPLFSIVALLTLAIGIGANTAIFSVVYAALLRPLPYPEGGRILSVQEFYQGRGGNYSPPDFIDWRARARTVSAAAAIYEDAVALSGDGPAQQLSIERVTSDFIPVMGVPPALGRGFRAENDSVGQDKVVLLSDALWRSRFQADRAIVGRMIRLDGEPYEVIGVMPPDFSYPAAIDLWMARAFTADEATTQRGAHYLDVIARMRPGVTLAQVNGELAAIGAQLKSAYPETNRDIEPAARSLRDFLVGDIRRPLYILLGAVALVLLIACTNVAGLLFARAVGREREVAVRTALGASRAQLVRTLIVEGVLLALLGAGTGILLSQWGAAILGRFTPPDIARLDRSPLNGPVLAFTVAVSVVASLLFSILPALHLTRGRDLSRSLRTGGRSGIDRQTHRVHRALVVGETALALMLLTGAVLLIRSFAELRGTESGFRSDHVLAFSASLPERSYQALPRRDGYFAQLEQRVRAMPGVKEVGATTVLPLSGGSFSISMHSIDGRALSDEEQDRLATQIRIVRPEYFRALRIRLVRGRTFTDADRDGTPPAVVMNQAAARLIFPGQDPIGHSLMIGTHMGLGQDRLRTNGAVIGIVADTREHDLSREARPELYFPHAQNPTTGLTVVVHTAGDPERLIEPIRREMAALDPDVPMYEVRTLDATVSGSVVRPRFYALLLGAFAAAALLLAAIGLYGVLGYAARQRTPEIGLRMALGARQRDVLVRMAAQGVILAVSGAAIGVLGSLAAGRLLAGLLYGVQPTDLTSLAVAFSTLLVVAFLASWIPARRAASVDPAIALRAE
jgi:predicted permease